MNQNLINELAAANQERAREVLKESGIADCWTKAGCRVNVIGSLRMRLLVTHRDIDLHVYSEGITTESSFSIMAEIARNPRVTEIRCINGLYTDEHCIAWHIFYKAENGETWKFDIIHIEADTEYDGYFERMADRITEVMTPSQRDTILRLKYEAPEDKDYHGVEFYEAVIADGVSTLAEFEKWLEDHRKKDPYYWIP